MGIVSISMHLFWDTEINGQKRSDQIIILFGTKDAIGSKRSQRFHSWTRCCDGLTFPCGFSWGAAVWCNWISIFLFSLWAVHHSRFRQETLERSFASPIKISNLSFILETIILCNSFFERSFLKTETKQIEWFRTSHYFTIYCHEILVCTQDTSKHK